ncbi:MAG: metallophosphoesterase [Clostridia bacterium]|nr:metallophosphoesterase [Clostridia bacterium]
MALFSISDLHLSLSAHKPMDIFGARWQEYTQKLEKAWRAAVTDCDTVVIPGDISWAMQLDEALEDLKFIDLLPGRKLLGKGNHDYWWTTLGKMRKFLAEHCITTIDFLHNNAYIRDGHVICGTRGWFIEERLQSDKSVDYSLISARECGRLKMSLDEGIRLRSEAGEDLPIIVYLHFPPVFGDFIFEDMLELMESYGVSACFYGHIHGNYSIPRSINSHGIPISIISADYLNFIPMLTKTG